MSESLEQEPCQKSPKIGKKRVARGRFWLRWLAPLTGLLALLWFLVRVIPKPSRAAYPCQRAAFPLASAFVLWLMQLAGLIVVARMVRRLFRSSRFLAALSVAAVILVAVSFSLESGDGSWFVPSDAALSPTGTPQGIYPGRVVWNYNPNATDWNGTSGYWYDHIDQEQVELMLSAVLGDLTGAGTDSSAWNKLFRHYNQNNGKGDVGYQANEKIVIKPNLNQSSSHAASGNIQITAPQIILALIRQLVYEAGMDDADITVYDATRYIPAVIYDVCIAEFPDVHFVDRLGGNGREQTEKDLNRQIIWSDDLQNPTEPGSGSPAYAPTCVTEADYYINLGVLKGHSLAGISVCAKNLFGGFMADPPAGGNGAQIPKSAGLHPYIAVHEFGGGYDGIASWGFDKRPMGSYNPLVDLMGHSDYGGKTILYLVDGLYAPISQNISRLDASAKWQSEPFCNDDGWPSSLFASQDPVAIESVALDFIRSEATIQEYPGVMDAGDTVDNYLHEAALADNPPSGTFYDPEGDGVRMESLGVHEHWNNATEKLYSGNIRPGTGIELISHVGFTDEDGDGLPDLWELRYYGSKTAANPSALCANQVDTVMTAYIAGLDPLSPLARFEFSMQQVGTSNAISWNGATDRVYRVYWTPDLGTSFELLGSNVHWSCDTFIDTEHQGEGSGFYRVDVLVP